MRVPFEEETKNKKYKEMNMQNAENVEVPSFLILWIFFVSYFFFLFFVLVLARRKISICVCRLLKT